MYTTLNGCSMSDQQAEFDALMQQVLVGSDEAAAKLLREFEPVLLRAIRRRLDKRLRSKFDSIDFAQDVWASFFAQERAERQFSTAEKLLAFLTTVARNKVMDKSRQRMKLQKFNVKREQSLDDSTKFDRDALPGNQPTPSHIVMSQEEWSEFLRKQPPAHRHIFLLLRDGKSCAEIARELNLHPRYVQRVAERTMTGAPE
jgi:RNA polymerase sigma factor (sigma-70 family)